MSTKRVFLTTNDNPYNPATEFDKWYAFDTWNGYNTCGVLASKAKTSDALTDLDNEQEIERAIDDIIAHDLLGIYKKVAANA